MATQSEIAEHLDLHDRHVRRLVADGILPASKGKGGLEIDACRLAYIRYLRGVQSGQVRPAGDETTAEESGDYTALLEQEKYRKAKRENDLEEKLVAPVSLLTDALLQAGAIIIPILESLPLVIKRYWPEVTGDQVQEIKRAVAECRNAIADMRIDIDA